MKNRDPYRMSSRQEKDVRYRSNFGTRPSGGDMTCSLNDDNQQDQPECLSESLVKALVSLLSGIIFGVAIEKGRVFEPQMIRDQMVFKNFTMLKMFLSATASGMLVFSLLNMIPHTIKRLECAIDGFICPIQHKKIWANILGAAMLGCGMTLAGACPGMVLAQVGAAVPSAVQVMAGGLVGAFLYALTDPLMPSFIQERPGQSSKTLDEFMSTPYFTLALPFSALLGLIVFALEVVFPWETEVEQSGYGIFGVKCWPPFVSGALIGLLQLPTVLVHSDTLGSSSSYMTIAAQSLIIGPLRWPLSHLRKFASGIDNWWQVLYFGGAIFGAYFSAKMSDTLYTVDGVESMLGFWGGVLMIYGSRLAGGCTSGHGLSGMGLLVPQSFVAVCSMFGSAIAVGVLMEYVLT